MSIVVRFQAREPRICQGTCGPQTVQGQRFHARRHLDSKSFESKMNRWSKLLQEPLYERTLIGRVNSFSMIHCMIVISLSFFLFTLLKWNSGIKS